MVQSQNRNGFGSFFCDCGAGDEQKNIKKIEKK